MTKEELLENARIIVREYSNPPFCCVCNKPLNFASTTAHGLKYACFQIGDWSQESMDHYDRSIRINPPLNKYIAEFAQNVIDQ